MLLYGELWINKYSYSYSKYSFLLFPTLPCIFHFHFLLHLYFHLSFSPLLFTCFCSFSFSSVVFIFLLCKHILFYFNLFHLAFHLSFHQSDPWSSFLYITLTTLSYAIVKIFHRIPRFPGIKYFRRHSDFCLKVPSHQIRSAWKWYGWTSSHGYNNRRG